MADEANITQETLNEVVTYVTNNLFKCLTTGTGSAPITLSTSDLQNPVNIEAANRNLSAQTLEVNDNFFRLKFRLEAGMPVSQPVDLQEFGLHKSVSATTGLTYGFTTNVARTKDNNSQWTIIITGRAYEEGR